MTTLSSHRDKKCPANKFTFWKANNIIDFCFLERAKTEGIRRSAGLQALAARIQNGHSRYGKAQRVVVRKGSCSSQRVSVCVRTGKEFVFMRVTRMTRAR